MSRIGKKPIKVPGGVKVGIRDGQLVVEGNKAKLSAPIPPGIRFELNGDTLMAFRESASFKTLFTRPLTATISRQ